MMVMTVMMMIRFKGKSPSCCFHSNKKLGKGRERKREGERERDVRLALP